MYIPQTKAEKNAIKRYHDAASILPYAETISGYWVPDFDFRFYKEKYKVCDPLDALSKYLQDLEPYAKAIQIAADLRQEHYVKYLKHTNLEDSGHKHWRKA